MWADEIIVLDSGSTDRTQEICKKFEPKLKLYVADWPGFGIQKNRALDFAKCNWVLSIDADEVVTPPLKEEILQLSANSLDNLCVGYKIPRVNYFLGKPIRCGLNLISDCPIRLAQKDHCRFSDDIIHEKLIVTGRVGVLKNHLDHFSFENTDELIKKIGSYSTVGAIKLYNNGKKTTFTKAVFHAFWAFIRIYFLKFGFLNGWRGFLLAFSNFEGTFYRYIKLLEKQS